MSATQPAKKTAKQTTEELLREMTNEDLRLFIRGNWATLEILKDNLGNPSSKEDCESLYSHIAEIREKLSVAFLCQTERQTEDEFMEGLLAKYKV